jgi:hypothetical protein
MNSYAIYRIAETLRVLLFTTLAIQQSAIPYPSYVRRRRPDMLGSFRRIDRA